MEDVVKKCSNDRELLEKVKEESHQARKQYAIEE